MSVNKNFISIAIKGVLAMDGGADSFDLASLQRVAASWGRISSRVHRMLGGLLELFPRTSGTRLGIRWRSPQLKQGFTK
jgi:hypothetical protein